MAPQHLQGGDGLLRRTSSLLRMGTVRVPFEHRPPTRIPLVANPVHPLLFVHNHSFTTRIVVHDIATWWLSNKLQSSLWDGPSAKPFLSLFDRKCLARWVAGASGHGDFLEYYLRFNNPQELLKPALVVR
jgi:hypothetical protein